MIAAAVAFTDVDTRLRTTVAGIAVFLIGSWARANVYLAGDGVTITSVWWLITLRLGGLMFAVGKPRIPCGLLTLAGALFRSPHVPPTGPLGAACIVAAAEYVALKKQGGRAEGGRPLITG